jgi:ABC-type transport system involved in multi-copper enzyme maturation permease subunit
MKRIIIISMIIYTLLGFGLGSIPIRNVNISDGTMQVDYGLPFRWLTVNHRVNQDRSQSTSMQLWKTDKRSFELSGLFLDLTTAVLAGVLLTMLTVRILQIRSRRVSKEGVSPVSVPNGP